MDFRDYNAKIGMQQERIGILLDEDAGARIMAAGTQGRVSIYFSIAHGKLLVEILPDREGSVTLVPVTDGRQCLPYQVRINAVHCPAEVLPHISRTMNMPFEVEGSKRGLSGEVELLPHLRPWPKIREGKNYDAGKRMAEVFATRMASTGESDDVWDQPPIDFLRKCPKSFMSIFNEMPEGFKLRMPDGRVMAR